MADSEEPTLNLSFFVSWLDDPEDSIPVTPTIERDGDDDVRR